MSKLIKFRVWDGKRYWISDIGPHSDEQGTCMALTDTWRDDTIWEHERVLEQFTGLTDKNGKEIYEGDIIRMGSPRYVDNVYIDNNIGVVQMFRTQWALHPVETLGKEHGGIIYFPLGEIPPVIGNIHENSSLLKS